MGEAVWPTVVANANLPDRLYLLAQQFPDSEFQALVDAAAKMMNIATPTLLEKLGEFVAPDLLQLHSHSVRPEWRTLDLIEHTEQAIHQVVRQGGSGARPPEIATKRTGENELVVAYVSQRKLCAFAKGIMRGIAAHYGERPHITETTCMLDGAAQCTIEIKIDART
jgi:predicted hydrocarbon binding protein